MRETIFIIMILKFKLLNRKNQMFPFKIFQSETVFRNQYLSTKVYLFYAIG